MKPMIDNFNWRSAVGRSLPIEWAAQFDRGVGGSVRPRAG